MRLLHTSDWHLGRALYGRRRYEEYEAFLDWLVRTLQAEAVDALLVAGDIFDTGTPSNRAQELYYHFLGRVATTSCRHVVIVGGNHDSPSFLEAPRDLLRCLNVHVLGSCSEDGAAEVLVLRDRSGIPELIVCAVPYLRDRDIRQVEAGEGVEDKERKLLEGITAHYERVGAWAREQRQALSPGVPIVGMGHLFAAGGQTVEGDGVRELYVGSLAHVPAGVFPVDWVYVALGHLHVPQVVNGQERIRYSGAPLAHGFGEARQQKSVVLVDITNGTVADLPLQPQQMPPGNEPSSVSLSLLPVPVFQELKRLRGDWDALLAGFQALVHSDSRAWLEVVYEGDDLLGDLRERLEEAVAGTGVELLRIQNRRVMERVLGQTHEEETLDDLNVHDVFARCLEAHGVPEAQRTELFETYDNVLQDLREQDPHAD